MIGEAAALAAAVCWAIGSHLFFDRSRTGTSTIEDCAQRERAGLVPSQHGARPLPRA
jgi:hypothetical protein